LLLLFSLSILVSGQSLFLGLGLSEVLSSASIAFFKRTKQGLFHYIASGEVYLG
jgi:hypothetical protein